MYGHWTYLGILWQTDGITQQQLSDQAGVMAPSTFAALRSMEESGYVTRRKMPGNRKEVRVFLTQKGAALRAVLVPAVEELNDTALAGIPAKDVALVRNTLRAIIDNLARAAEIGTDHRSGHDHAIPINRVRRRL
jgi:DNA-binding MarR family transcriptional regulator